MKTVKPSSERGRSRPKKPATTKQYDDAFDSLATFLFEQYRKFKEEV